MALVMTLSLCCVLITGSTLAAPDTGTAVSLSNLYGYWSFYPPGYRFDMPNNGDLPQSAEPYILSFHTDGTMLFQEGVLIEGGVGDPFWFSFSYAYEGTYNLTGNIIDCYLTGFEGEDLNIQIAVESTAGDTLSLKWQSAPPPYYQGDGGLMRGGKWNDHSRWVSAGGALFIGEGAFSGTVEFASAISLSVPFPNLWFWDQRGFDEDEIYRSYIDRPTELLSVPVKYITTNSISIYPHPGEWEPEPIEDRLIPAGTEVKVIGYSKGNTDMAFIEYYATVTELLEYTGGSDSQVNEFFMYGWVETKYLQDATSPDQAKWEKAYASVLNEYKIYAERHFAGDQSFYTESLSFFYGGDGSDLGYGFLDIDQNGTPELLLLQGEDMRKILGLYSLVDSKPNKLYMCGKPYRLSRSIDKSNYTIEYWSEGPDYEYYGIDRLNANANDWVTTKSILKEPDPNFDIYPPIYIYTLTVGDTTTAITQAEFEQLIVSDFVPSREEDKIAFFYIRDYVAEADLADVSLSFTTYVGEKERSISVDFSDEQFADPATTYNHQLALAGSALSAATAVGGKTQVRSNLEDKLGFKANRIKEYNYEVENTRSSLKHIVAYTIASKEINTGGGRYNLVVIVVRGTKGAEWYSNMDVGTGTDHYGFKTATDELYNNLFNYLNMGSSSENIDHTLPTKYFITGHSRGAAVANLLAAMLTDVTDTSRWVYAGKNNIYAYTFATPNVTKNTAASIFNADAYANIFNFVNAEDMVTRLPLSSWNFSRYGKTLMMNFGDTDPLFGEYEFRDFTGQVYQRWKDGGSAVDLFVKDVEWLAKDVNEYYNRGHNLVVGGVEITPYEFMRGIAASMAGDSSILDDSFISLGALFAGYAPLIRFLGGNSMGFPGWVPGQTDRITHAHAPETYIVWLQVYRASVRKNAVDENDLVRRMRKMFIGVHCPIDVEIYDSNNQLVGKVVDNVVTESVTKGIAVSVSGEDNGEKNICLPSNEVFTLKLISTDAGSMDFTAQDVDTLTMETLTKKAFTNVALTKGKVMSIQIGGHITVQNIRLFVMEGDVAVREVLEDGYEIDCTNAATSTNPPRQNDLDTPERSDTTTTHPFLAQEHSNSDGNKFPKTGQDIMSKPVLFTLSLLLFCTSTCWLLCYKQGKKKTK